ncbi:MAG: DMT family transporter [Verrucomicrobiota bacterium]|jgi:drug/metabolite transporter (DMT)-like permease
MVRVNSSLKAAAWLLLATLCWSVSFTVMRALVIVQQRAVPGAGTWFIANWCVALRFGLAALVVLLWQARSLSRLTRSEIAQGAGLGFFGAGGLVLQMDGLAYTSASTSAFLTQCYCLMIPLWVAITARRWPPPWVALSCVLVVAGVAILAGVDWSTFRLGRGELETLLASVLFTGQILWLQRADYTGNDANRFSLVMFVVMALGSAAAAATSRHAPGDWLRAYATPPTWGFLAVLVVICTLGGYLLMNRWQTHVTATEAGLIYCAEPVFASAAALFLPAWFSRWAAIAYPNELLTRNLVAGGGLVLLANVILQLAPAGTTAPPVAPAAGRQPADGSVLPDHR